MMKDKHDYQDRNRHRNRRHPISDIKFFINGNIDDFDEKVEPYYLGKMDVSCMHCNAQMFEHEKLKSSSRNIKKFGLCCFEGKIVIPQFTNLPNSLKELYENDDEISKYFRESYKKYHSIQHLQ